MDYFSPSTGRVVSTGEFAALLGAVPSPSQLLELGYYELTNPYENIPVAEQILIPTGNAQQGETYTVTHSVKPDILENIRKVVAYENSQVGKVVAFAANNVPGGYLECDGSILNMADYPRLGEMLSTTYGGDGTTTFGIPDLRGEFIRGWDNGAGVDSGRVFGSNQSDELAAHDHYIPTNDASAAGSFTVADLANQTLDYTNLSATSSTGGTETRPKNVALLYCIYTGVHN